MSNLEELQTVEPAGEAFTALAHNINLGHPDIVCFINKGQLPGRDESTTELFVATDADEFYSTPSTLGVAEIEVTEPGKGHLRLVAEERFTRDADDLRGFASLIMKEAGLKSAYLDTEADTNVSPKVLEQAGATAIGPHVVEFQFAA